MFEQEIFNVRVNADQCEGRGPMVVLGRFSSKGVAEAIVRDPRFKRWCVQGQHNPEHELRYGAVQPETIRVFDTTEQFWAEQERDRRKEALAKLNAEDRKILGLSDE